MKNKNIFLTVLIAAVLAVSSCTDKFEEMNTNSVNISKESLKQDFNNIGSYFIPVKKIITGVMVRTGPFS